MIFIQYISRPNIIILKIRIIIFSQFTLILQSNVFWVIQKNTPGPLSSQSYIKN